LTDFSLNGSAVLGQSDYGINLKMIPYRIGSRTASPPTNSDSMRNKNALVCVDKPGSGFAAARARDALQMYPSPRGENPDPGKPQDKNALAVFIINKYPPA